MTYIAPSGMLDRSFVSGQQWRSGLGSVLPLLPTCNVGWFTNIWSTYSEKRFKETFRLSRSTVMFVLGLIRNANEKDTITEELISPEAQIAIWAFIANRQFASQAFIFSVHETWKTDFQHAVQCQQWLLIACHSQAKMSLYSTCSSGGK